MWLLTTCYPFKSDTEHLFASMAQWYSTCFESKHTGVKSGIQVRVLLLAFVAYWDKRLVHRALTPEVAVRSRNRPFLPWWLNWYSSRLLICHLGVISGFGVQVPATALKHLNKFSDLSLQQIGKICCNFLFILLTNVYTCVLMISNIDNHD